MSSFSQQVFDIVAQIPRGKVISYGQIARLLGHPRGARQVGWAMRNCPDGLPWQRVVMADGSITGGDFAELRREKLASEGVEFLPDGRVNMSVCRWIV
ncbi:MAG: methylated-DNA--[protein]-cysteine S-methyltransferase [Oscillospiraceae bacterium]|nr:methylated-DNA--[protein]-cysteine S-methyltransferase [Oscillospiraceae bacterium]